MNYPASIFIFDIDGVLVKPLGYRAATLATLQHFIHKMELDENLAPDMDTLEWFEAMHITSEWDMVPLSLALLLEALAESDQSLRLPEALGDLAPLNVNHRLVGKVDYRTPLQTLSASLEPQEYPSATALRLADAPAGLFPRLSGSPLLAEILSHSRDPYRSPTTRLFQHFSLGSRVFEQVYGMPASLETPSLLAACDLPQLTPQAQQSTRGWIEAGRVAAVALTNRPSYPPREVAEPLRGYPPEAEMALELNGLGGIPLISFGRIRYLAERHNLEPETLLKPSPVPAMAAVLAALTGEELPALEAALQLVGISRIEAVRPFGEPLAAMGIDPHRLPAQGLKIHIFEDTRGGIEATRLAGEWLARMGLANQVFAWGVADGEYKVASLLEAGAVVLPNVSAAVQAAAELI